MRPNKDVWFIEIAVVVAKRATCLRRSVGCVLVNRHGHTLATGYNGVARGLPHCNEAVVGEKTWRSPFTGEIPPDVVHPHACSGASSPSGTNLDACQAIHAEQNALLQCRDVEEIQTCYVTTSPCVTCVKLLMNTPCRRIVFLEPYAHDQEARRLWEQVAGREWVHLNA